MLRFLICAMLVLPLCGLPPLACAASDAQETLRKMLWTFSNSMYTTHGVSLSYEDEERPWHIPAQCLRDGSFDRVLESWLNNAYDLDYQYIPQECRLDPLYLEDLANNFLYTYDDGPTCGCPLQTIAKAYPKKDGSHVYLKYSYRYCAFTEESAASQPWQTILPEGFSENSFLENGEKFPLTALSNFIARVHVARTHNRIAVSLRPQALGMAQPPIAGLRFATADGEYRPDHKDLQFTAALLLSGADILGKALQEGAFDAVTAMDIILAEAAAQKQLEATFPMKPDMYSLDQFQQEARQIYAVYATYRRIAFSEIIMEWDANKGRFHIVKKVKAMPLTFQEFLNKHLNVHKDFWLAIC